MNNLEAKLEAILFLYGEPIKLKKLAEILGVEQTEVKEAAMSLAKRVNQAENRGLNIIVFDDRVQLTTKPELKSLLTKIANEELDNPLTPASLETLAIIAYLGPCNRSLIEYIRGVNSTFILRSLMIRGLIERHPDPKRANAFVYQVSFDFLRHIGINSPEELPDYGKHRQSVQLFLDGEQEN